jgi:hypothetical protein
MSTEAQQPQQQGKKNYKDTLNLPQTAPAPAPSTAPSTCPSASTRPATRVFPRKVRPQASHAQRLGDAVLNLICEPLLSRTLHDGAEQHVALGRILELLARRVRERRFLELVQGHDRLREGVWRAVLDLRLEPIVVNDAAPVAEQLPRGDFHALVRELGNIGAHVRVEVEQAFFSQLHRGHCGERLGYRRPAEPGLVEIDRNALFAIGVAVAFRPRHPALIDHDHGEADDLLLLDLRKQGTVDLVGVEERPILRERGAG